MKRSKMAKQFLNSMFSRGQMSFDPVTRKMIPMRNDFLLYTEKDTETLETVLKIIPHPMIEFYIAKTPQPYHKMQMPMDEVRTVKAPYVDRGAAIAECLGKKQEYFFACRNGYEAKRDFIKTMMRNPNLYGADCDIEDFYKTKMVLQNMNDAGEQTVAPKYNLSFSDIEVDISEFEEDFPDPQVAPCPINLITNIFMTEKICISYILHDRRVAEDQLWVVKNPSQFVKEYLDPMIINEGLKFTFKMFKDELELIKEYFKDLHKYKPDFCAWWNISFDFPTILNRLKRMGMGDREIADIMCHPDVPSQYRIVNYKPDPKRRMFVIKSGVDDEEDTEDDEEEDDARSKNSKNKPPPSRLTDVVEISGYTQHYDQMALFSNMRKRSLLPSYKLDDIGKEYGSITKYNLAEHGLSIKDANVKNFKAFLGYNIRDSFVQYKIEQKQQDIPNSIIGASTTKFNSSQAMSICVRNELMFYLYKEKQVMGNAIDYGVHEKFEGAIVAKPELLEQKGIQLVGAAENSGLVFSLDIDLDFSSLYPSIIITSNITKPALYGHIVQVNVGNGETVLENGYGNLGEDLQIIDGSIFDITSKYYGLPGPAELAKEIIGSIK